MLNVLKYPLYVKQSEDFGGQAAGLIVHELLLNGYAEMSGVILRVVARLANEPESERDPKKLDSLCSQVRECFGKLVGSEYIERLVRLESKSASNEMDSSSSKETTSAASSSKLEKLPKFSNINEERFELPTIKIDSRRLILIV